MDIHKISLKFSILLAVFDGSLNDSAIAGLLRLHIIISFII